MQSFRHLAAPLRIFHGPDSLGSLRGELERVGSRRAVIVCGSSIASPAGGLDLVRSALGDRCLGVFTGVLAHSPLPAVIAAAEALDRFGADAVIALGGGSAIVTARAASVLLAEKSDIRHLCTSRDANGKLVSPKLPAPKLPQFVIPTTPTTATVKAGSAVLDPTTHGRLALFDPKTRTQAVFVHPQLIAAAPRALVESAALNTLAMAVEGLLSLQGDPIADALLMHALRLLSDQLPSDDGNDRDERRAGLMMASLLCGHGTDFTGAGIAIPLGHAISAHLSLDNGIANAIVLPHVLRFNADAARAGLAKVAHALDAAGAGADALAAVQDPLIEIFDSLGIARRLRDVGASRNDLPALAEVAAGDWFVRTNPRPVRGAGDLLEVLEAAW